MKENKMLNKEGSDSLYFEESYKLFLDKWGKEAQMRMAIEEMSELTKEISKYIRYSRDYNLDEQNKQKLVEIEQNIKEELADVLNTAEQLEYLFGKEEVTAIRKQKIERALKKIKS